MGLDNVSWPNGSSAPVCLGWPACPDRPTLFTQHPGGGFGGGSVAVSVGPANQHRTVQLRCLVAPSTG